MPHINTHPAPGLGDLLPGWFVVPQNPIMDAQDGVTPTTKYVPHMGELMPGLFVVPQNPLINALSGATMPGYGGGRGVGGGMGCGTCGNDKVALSGTLRGMGDFSLDSITSGIGDTISGITPTTWMYIGGGVLVLMLLMSRPGGSEYRSALSSESDRHRKEVARIRSRYPRTGSRIKRGARAAYDAL